MPFDYDLFCIGAGSGGVRACRMAAEAGAQVAVAEESELGGTCVNVGCIPKKLLVYAAHFREDLELAAAYGSQAQGRFDWRVLLENKNREIERLNGVYAELLDAAGVERIAGRARLVDRHTVAVGERRYSAATILIATGGWPELPPVPGAEHGISSNEAFFLDEWPERVVIVGGGYIAVEFAGIFHGIGARVDLLYRGPLFLRGFDDDVRSTLAEELSKKGVRLHFDAQLRAIEKDTKGLRVRCADGEEYVADQVLLATGRRPKTADLGLAEAGVAVDELGAVVVDEYSQTSVPNIYAVGDCTNRLNLTPVALHEAAAFVNTVFAGRPTRAEHSGVASAVFSQPELGSVGLTEAEARERYDAVDVYRSKFRPLKHTVSGRDERAMLKLLVDPATDRVLGCHMVGPEAGEIIQGFAVALKCGATKAQFDATVGIHPTTAEEFVTMRRKVAAPGSHAEEA